jgi:hypothetical protein
MSAPADLLEPRSAAAPDLIEPVVGFRYWELRDGALWSLFDREPWHGTVLSAECRKAGSRFGVRPAAPHTSPHRDCSCGIYAFHRRPDKWAYPTREGNIVAGAVTLSGRLEVHGAGVRAEHARVHALAPEPNAGRALRLRLGRAARRLGIPVVPYGELETAVASAGRALPDDLLPDDEVFSGPFLIRYRKSDEAPAFRFLLEREGGQVWPWAWWNEDRLPDGEPWRGALGDVFTLEGDRALVSFARVTHGLRQAAEQALLEWAEEDGWSVEFSRGTVPLARPRRDPDSRTLVCSTCGDASELSFSTAKSVEARGYWPTRCPRCRVRRRTSGSSTRPGG